MDQQCTWNLFQEVEYDSLKRFRSTLEHEMKTKDERAKEIMSEIHTVLLHDWDPLGLQGIAPDDEYDSYIGGVYRLLTQRPPVDDVVRYLMNLEFHDMGNTKRKNDLIQVAERLLQINVRLESE
jgi:hypothetical protein